MNRPEIYPQTYEEKIGFDEIRGYISKACSSTLGRGLVASLHASTDAEEIRRAQEETREMIAILSSDQVLPSLALDDQREALARIRPQGTWLEVEELQGLVEMLSSLHALHSFFEAEHVRGSLDDDSLEYAYPTLSARIRIAAAFPKIEHNIRQLFDAEGQIKDTASKELYRIRQELRETERSLSGIMRGILRLARNEGWIEEDVQPSVRDGRLVIPLAPQHKRKIKGIVYDTSSTGKTIFVEPVEMVEANNKIRELETEERKEIVRILLEIANRLRPNIQHLLSAYEVLAHFDLVRAKALWAGEIGAICPTLEDGPSLDWAEARHPLLIYSLRALCRSVVPLDITLEQDRGRIVLISGPNAGGKSVCLKTVGLLQYMIQAGLPVPMGERSTAGVFRRFYLDIGDEQSLEDDLSTYSSHLSNMKHFQRGGDAETLLLVDEFGGGTEPTIGGAIAQALLGSFLSQGLWGVITTHYQNLKTFAEEHEGIVNAAMLYDRHEMKPLFRLSIGRPGSSFAIEIARKIGLSEAVIEEARGIVGSDYIDMDKYLQDIVRDKRYWEGKRQSIRKEEKRLEEAIERYDEESRGIERERKRILDEARREAERLVQEAGKRIEKTIKEIREASAERERTLIVRKELNQWVDELKEQEEAERQTKKQAKAQRELEKMLRRRERRGQSDKGAEQEEIASKLRQGRSSSKANAEKSVAPLAVGEDVVIEGQRGVGTLVSIDGDRMTIGFGLVKITVGRDKVRRAGTEVKRALGLVQERSSQQGRRDSIVDHIHEKRLSFRSDLDLRGMRAAEAVEETMRFVDEALQLGIDRVRILHGTGTGALREAIRSYLKDEPSVRRFADEHVQLGGAGITVIDLS